MAFSRGGQCPHSFIRGGAERKFEMIPTGLGHFDVGGELPLTLRADIVGRPNGLVFLLLRGRVSRFKARTRIPTPRFGIIPNLEIVIGGLGRAVLFRNLSEGGRTQAERHTEGQR